MKKIKPEDLYCYLNFNHIHKESVIEEIDYQQKELERLKNIEVSDELKTIFPKWKETNQTQIQEIEDRLVYLRNIPLDNFDEWRKNKLDKIIEMCRNL